MWKETLRTNSKEMYVIQKSADENGVRRYVRELMLRRAYHHFVARNVNHPSKIPIAPLPLQKKKTGIAARARIGTRIR